MKKLLRVAMIVIAVSLACASAASAANDIGVIFMHGKWGTNERASSVGKLVTEIQRAGFLVDFPEMPWSKTRLYDRDVDGALAEVDAALQRLRNKGATRIVVAGQSLGANFALAYAARRGDVVGVLMISPGHAPDQENYRKFIQDDLNKAAAMVRSGKGDTTDSFLDVNQGESRKIKMSAKTYVSWEDVSGGLVMPKNAEALKPGIALAWIVGEKDGMAQQGKAYVFAKAPVNPNSLYAVVSGGTHANTAASIAPIAVDWLKKL